MLCYVNTHNVAWRDKNWTELEDQMNGGETSAGMDSPERGACVTV